MEISNLKLQVEVAGTRPQSRCRLAIFIFQFAIALCALTFTNAAAADEPPHAELERRRKDIEKMTEVERDRIKRNFDDYRKLSSEKKADLKELHERVEKDEELHKTLQEYNEWLSKLSPGQRDDLRKESDPARRAKKVAEIREEQQRQERSGFSPGSGPRFGSGRMAWSKWIDSFGLASNDLKAVMSVWEQAAQNVLNPEQKQELQSLAGLHRYVFVIRETIRFEPSRGGGPSSPPKFLTDQKLIADMIAAISNAEKKSELQALHDQPDRQRGRLMAGIAVGIYKEIDSKKPSAAILEEFFKTLDGKKKDEIYRAPADQFERLVFKAYQEAHPQEFPPHPDQVLWSFLPRFGPGPGGPGGSGNFGPRGQGGPGGDQRRGPGGGGPGNRPDGNRPPEPPRGEKTSPPIS